MEIWYVLLEKKRLVGWLVGNDEKLKWKYCSLAGRNERSTGVTFAKNVFDGLNFATGLNFANFTMITFFVFLKLKST